MNHSRLSSPPILLVVLVCAFPLLACNVASLIAQSTPTEIPTVVAQAVEPDPSATKSLSIPSPIIQATTANAPVKTTAPPTAVTKPSATVGVQAATRSPTPLVKSTSTATKATNTQAASTATRTNTPKPQTGCVANSPQAKSSGMIASVALGTKSSPTAALVATSVFATNATIYAVVTTQNAPDTAMFKAEWYVTDVGSAAPCNTFIDRAELSSAPSIDFSLAPSTKWPIGSYRVEIYVNGTLDRAANFTIK